jgi:uncharacterized protein YqeY
MSDASLSLQTRLRNDLLVAMKERDTVATKALRSLLDALDNACAVPLTAEHALVYGDQTEVPRKLVTESEYQLILRNEANSRSAAASEFEQWGRSEAAARVRAELSVILRYTE